ncbi:ECF RNA polymerase sigma factor RpoE [Zhongshania aliphaticivorans]|uniref:ECF RNA polymerase sigma factor RpoE n=1 Tax=Zhongshania aliphaticivorans TaxID=1470434 RepID=A0A5S9NLF8_9GAMM|nr:sigma-70 family RNA polymerase sigma factor [Zhongshania aliphaticivorans]CAA0091331.1 ECF RNA polymerase sigma factor RpoE [Zhongshania aliphaticivorans]CAA0098738.1 ECF RNA polymerase sigma factor RpoE [Zhongshania aliphaticivorans]
MAGNAAEPERNGEFWADCVARITESRDKDSFMLLFDHFSPRVNAYLLGQGAAASMAEDLTQEALLALWNKAHLYHREKAAVSTWLFRVARNLWIDKLRKQRGIAYESDENLAETADSEVRLNADGERLKAVLDTLPVNQAQVVYKSYYEGKSHSEIAEELSMPLGSVKSSLRLAIRAFRQHFGENDV